MTDISEIRTALAEAAAGFLAEYDKAEPLPGWTIMFRHKLEFENVGAAKILTLPPDSLEGLLKLAETNPHAFDAAKYLASLHIAAGKPLVQLLRLFAAQVLSGEISRPKQKGRPLSGNVMVKCFQYQLAVYTHSQAGIPLSRNDVSGAFCACDAVAEAFTQAGRYTTFATVKSLCYDAAYSNIRALGAWIETGRFLDVGQEWGVHLEK